MCPQLPSNVPPSAVSFLRTESATESADGCQQYNESYELLAEVWKKGKSSEIMKRDLNKKEFLKLVAKQVEMQAGVTIHPGVKPTNEPPYLNHIGNLQAENFYPIDLKEAYKNALIEYNKNGKNQTTDWSTALSNMLEIDDSHKGKSRSISESDHKLVKAVMGSIRQFDEKFGEKDTVRTRGTRNSSSS